MSKKKLTKKEIDKLKKKRKEALSDNKFIKK